MVDAKSEALRRCELPGLTGPNRKGVIQDLRIGAVHALFKLSANYFGEWLSAVSKLQTSFSEKPKETARRFLGNIRAEI